MLLALDIGNTDMKLAAFAGETLKASWRVSTDRRKTSDEYGLAFTSLLSVEGVSPAEVTGVIAASVVPTVNYTVQRSLERYFKRTPLWVEPGIKTGLNIRLDNPRELGADLIADAVAAYGKYGGPCVVLDFGTATTFSAITQKGEFLGGCICPGVKVSMEGLVEKAAKLPKIELAMPERAIGRNTIDSMRAGLLFGYVGQVEYLIARFKQELGAPEARVIATGGMARTIAGHTKSINTLDNLLTLEGLRRLYELNT